MPCQDYNKFKNSVAQNQQHAGQEVSWQPSADKTPQRKDKWELWIEKKCESQDARIKRVIMVSLKVQEEAGCRNR